MSFRSHFGSDFPFDDTEDRANTRQRLSDLAQRHPEFAEHLNPDSWGRSRASPGAGVYTDDPFIEFRNRARITDFGFPFDEFDNPRYFERFRRNQQQPPEQNQPPQQQQQQQSVPPQHAQPPPPTQPSSASVFEKPPAGPDSGKKIQQSNTVDLGQPQAPLVDESRTHRSMSAPPEHPNVASGKRYVNRVTLPNVNAEMGGSASQPQPSQGPSQPQQQHHPEPPHGNPKERIIPIHVEGRDEVVTPSAQTQQQHQPQSQPDRIFGQRPGIFTQYVNTQEPAQDDARQQPQSHAEPPPPPQSQSPPPPLPKLKPSSLDLIQNIQKEVSDLMTQVENFDGKPRDKTYIYLDEMLTRKMILLDDIETGGQDAIRKARKEAIKCIQDTIKVLENKAQANDDASKMLVVQDIAPDSSAEPAATIPQPQPTDEAVADDVSTTTPGGEAEKEMEVEESAAVEEQPKSEAETKEGATEKKRAKRKAAKK